MAERDPSGTRVEFISTELASTFLRLGLSIEASEVAHRDLGDTRAELISVILDLVATFLKIARTSQSNETRRRNQTHARKAYELARRYLSQAPDSPEILRGFEKRFSETREELEAVGEIIQY